MSIYQLPLFLLAASLSHLAITAASTDTVAAEPEPLQLSKQERYQRLLVDWDEWDLEEEELPPVQPRIVGGDIVSNNKKYPFFLEWEDAKCGASLIHDDIALSAAHCENDAHPFDTRVFMLGLETESGLERYVEYTTAHPLYSGTLQDYDFVLLKLKTSALVDENGNPTGAETVKLNKNPNIPKVGDALTGMGFGKLDQDASDTSQWFNEVEIYYVDNDVCQEQYGTSDFLSGLMFCAGVVGGGQDTCQGDSGGPIIHQQTKTQVGVVSFGIGCALPNYSGVNARVSAVDEWIEDQICELSDFPPARCNANANANGTGNANGNANGNSNGNANGSVTPPPTGSPTIHPDVLPAGGVGEMTVHVEYDDYPRETAWSFSFLSMPNDQEPLQLYLHPFDDSIPNRDYRTESFSDLPTGTYALRFGDQAGDGMCCQYGSGKVWLTNDKTGNTIWSNDGKYGSYVEVLVEVNGAGAVAILTEDFDYDNSWEAYDAVNHPPTFDGEWPGAYPNAAAFSVAVNIKFDAFPEEIDWKFYNTPAENGNWNILGSMNGAREGVHNTLVSKEVNNLSEGWHRLSITDSQGDGICCRYRRGWASITAPIVTTKTKGLVWGNNGEFGSGAEIYMLMDADGYVSQVSYTDPFVAATTRGGENRRRDLENEELRHLSQGTFTDLPKQGLKPLLSSP